MVSTFFYASALALLSAASAQTSYPANTNTGCTTSSDVDYQGNYYYNPNDTMDWGFYTQSQGTCDPGSYARAHVKDPSGNDIDCGYVALDGKLNLVSCSNYPRGYMQEGTYTVYWETVPGVSQYSWNQFTLIHTQATVTAPTPTNSVTTTPVTVITSTLTSSPTDTSYVPQKTITTPSATQINTVQVTPSPTTITTTSTSYYSITQRKYAQVTTTAVVTAACKQAAITNDFTATRGSTKQTTQKKVTRETLLDFFRRLAGLRRRDGDQPNTVGMAGPPLTTTFTPDAVLVTVTAATATSTVTTTTVLATVTVTIENPTPTVTVYSGVAVTTTTVTLAQVTKSVVRNKLAITYITTTSTLYYTKKSTTTPVCAPTPI